ncbi:hypothetical protein LCGC14_0994790 [marine sediment metagenome]|uniref:Phage tail collar domain-containing protein n=1 Tax=marine sediment metagenome TaxID=412755 RepID=A0A0F9RB33_9ZZZZ
MIQMRALTKHIVKGMIQLWYGSIASIPGGWQLCDGTNGSPDLDTRYVMGSGAIRNPGEIGGTNSHDHSFTGASHQHTLPAGSDIAAGADFAAIDGIAQGLGSINSGAHQPKFMSLCYIMKL